MSGTNCLHWMIAMMNKELLNAGIGRLRSRSMQALEK